MLIGGMIYHQLGNDLQPAPVRFLHEVLEIPQGSVCGMDFAKIRNVVAIVFPGRREKWQQPDRRYAKSSR